MSTSFNTSGGRLGAMLTNLGNDLPIRQRTKLSLLDKPVGDMAGGRTGGSGEDLSSVGELHHLLNMECRGYYSRIVGVMGDCNEALRAVLGPQSVSRQYRQKYYKSVKTQATMKQYSSRMARFVRLFYTLSLNETLRGSIGDGILGESMLASFKEFAEHVEDETYDSEDLHALLLAIARYNGGLGTSYKDCLPCLYAAVVLSDSKTGEFVNVETTGKVLSALKFFLRGALIIEAQREIEEKEARGVVMLEVDQVKCLRGMLEVVGGGSTNTLTTVARMGKVIHAYELPAQVRLIFPDPTDSRYCFVNGKEFGHLSLRKMVDVATSKATRILKRLMLGYTFESGGYQEDSTTVRLPGFAFGRNPNRGTEDPYIKKRSRRTLHDRFWLPAPDDSDGDVNGLLFNGAVACAFLRECMELEKHVVVINHVLGGCGTRGPDFQSQTFRNGPDTKRNVFILGSTLGDQVMAFGVPNSKRSLLLNKASGVLRFVECAQVDFLLPYYLVVRPWAVELRRCITRYSKDLTAIQVERLHPVARWDRFLYVSSSAETKRNHIAKAAADATGNKGITFNEVRHVAVALHRKFIVPQEHIVQAAFPVEQGFGHTQQADNRYGLDALTQEYGSCDASSVLRCSRSWWKLLGY
jgi:hypothetical protein